MVLILSESDVASLLSMAEAVSVVEQGFRQYAQGQVLLPPRLSQDLPGTAGALRVVSAVLPTKNFFGVKTLTGYPGRRTPGETYFALLLFEMGTGALRAIIAANDLTCMRTGAATGVAVKYLARQNARVHDVLGAGTQAKCQIQAVASVRSIEKVKIFARTPEKANAFAKSISKELGIDAQAVPTAQDAVIGSDIVTAITTAREPVVLGKWLEDGTHITSAGANTPAKMELDAVCFSRSKVITDSQSAAMEEGGDLRAALRNGDITSEHLYAELGEVVNGTKKGRNNEHELTLFKSIGLGFQDVALAIFLFERAVETGVGSMVDFEGMKLANDISAVRK
jgi:alanine dehydrogenase